PALHGSSRRRSSYGRRYEETAARWPIGASPSSEVDVTFLRRTRRHREVWRSRSTVPRSGPTGDGRREDRRAVVRWGCAIGMRRPDHRRSCLAPALEDLRVPPSRLGLAAMWIV